MMSEDDKKPEQEDVNAEENISEEEVQDAVLDALDHVEEVKAQTGGEFEDLDAKLDAIAAPIVKTGAGFGSLLVAALLGGVATVVLIGGIGYYAMSSNGLGGISNLLNGGDAAAANEERYTDVSTRVLSLEGEIAELLSAEPVATDLTPVSDKIDALADALSAESDQVTAIGERIGNVEKSIASVAQKDDGSFDNTILIAMQAEIDGLKNMSAGDVDTSELDAAIEAVQGKLAELETEVAAVKATADAAATSGAKISSGDANNMAAALAVAALERALQDEKPFEVELNAIKSVANDNAALDSLSAYAVTGLASETSLLGQFDGLLESALVADLKGEGTSILDRFIGNAKSIISVRKTGNVEGNSAEAVLARMEVAVKAKDLAGAVETASALEGPAAGVFAEWLTSAQSRLAAKDLMRQVSADILTSLQ